MARSKKSRFKGMRRRRWFAASADGKPRIYSPTLKRHGWLITEGPEQSEVLWDLPAEDDISAREVFIPNYDFELVKRNRVRLNERVRLKPRRERLKVTRVRLEG